MNRDLKMAALAACVMLTLGFSGCTPVKPTPPDTTRIVFAPIIPSLDDDLTDETAQQILLHNCVGYRLGYWDTPGMKEACSF